MTIIRFMASLHDLSLEFRGYIELVEHTVAVQVGRDLRESGEPVLEHPFDVMRQLMDMNMPQDVVIAGGLHDMIEDTPITFEDIKKHFGYNVAYMVDAVSKRPKSSFATKEERLQELYSRWKKCAQKCFYVIFIRGADRKHNLVTLPGLQRSDPEKVLRVSTETLEEYVPYLREEAKEVTPKSIHHHLDRYADEMEKLAQANLIAIRSILAPP